MAGQMETSTEKSMSGLAGALEKALTVDADAFANAIQMNVDEEELTQLISSMMSGEDASYANNLTDFGYADPETPSGISIYPKDLRARNP